MSFEAVLGNKEFEFVVSEVTLIVVTRRSASGHGVSVLVLVTGRVLRPKKNICLFTVTNGLSGLIFFYYYYYYRQNRK
jgi:hypothetical protein